jgi:hypothetical protein
MSIKQKLILAISACVLVLAAITAALVGVASERAVAAAAEQAVEAAGAGLLAMERADVEKLGSVATVLCADPALAAAFRSRDRARVLALAGPAFRGLQRSHGVTHLSFHLPDRTSFLRVHEPQAFGDRIERATLAAAAETGAPAAGKELGATAFALRLVQPWEVDGERLGFIEVGEEIGHFLGRLREQSGDDFVLLIGKQDGAGRPLVERQAWAAMRARQQRPDDWEAFPRFLIADDTAGQAASLVGLDLTASGPGLRRLPDLARGDLRLARGLLPVTDVTGRQVGAVVVVHDVTALSDGLGRARTGVLIMLLAVTILMGMGLLALVQRLVFARLERLAGSLEGLGARLAGGEYDLGQAPGPAGPADEIGRLEEFLGGFLAGMGRLVKELTARR